MTPRTGSAILPALSLVLLAAALPARGDEPWSYNLGRERSNQQANFCTERDAALQVARVFREQGPRPGYEALEAARACRRMVLTYTPREIIRQVTISAGKLDEYVVNFVRVETSAGRQLYLVTSRTVK